MAIESLSGVLDRGRGVWLGREGQEQCVDLLGGLVGEAVAAGDP
jgi:hypothetical protein